MGGAVAIPGVPFPAGRACFFLDFDGTLVDHAASPAAIHVPESLRGLLSGLLAATDGALAIVTGRALADIDAHLAPLRLPTAALHGAITRNAGVELRTTVDAPSVATSIATLRAPLQRHVAATPGLSLEDKDLVLAVHFRGAPHSESATRALLRQLVAGGATGLEVFEGACVLELRSVHADKGRAVEAFLREPPFAGRRPVFIGDDLTDLDGMQAVRRHGGMGISVGDRVAGDWRLESPTAVRTWLSAFLADRARSDPKPCIG